MVGGFCGLSSKRADAIGAFVRPLHAIFEFADLGIGGFAAAAVEELVTTARSADGDAAADAQAALALLLRLSGDRGAA